MRTRTTTHTLPLLTSAVVTVALLTVALGACGRRTEEALGSDHAATTHQHGTAAATSPATGGKVRRYFIAADVVDWDYAPSGKNLITGEAFDDTAKVFTQHGADRIGTTYRKSVYHGYTDSTFTTRTTRAAEDAYMGQLGPTIRAEVGDTIEVTFRNNTPFPASVHPHGVFYDANSEGAPYAGHTGGDDAVPTGGTHVYRWQVPERAGPGPGDGSTVMWMYHSHSDEAADVYAGLMGAMVVTRRGMARPDGSAKDVDREVFMNYEVEDENGSVWRDWNIAHRTDDPTSVDPDDEDFGESNLMHGINGYVYGNMPKVTLRKGDRTRWYLMAMGTEVDLHTPHWHGNTVLAMGMRMDTVSVFPATMVTADMVPDNVGTWLFHCHVNDHLAAGMVGTYAVTAR